MSGSLAVKVGVEGKWVDAKDAGLVAVFMNGPTFRAFRRYYNAGSPALVALDPELDDVQQLQHETFRTAPVPEADPDVPRALVHAVREYNREMPVDVAAGDLVRVPNVTPGCAAEPHLGHFAMVESLLRDDCNGSTRWHVVLRPWLDDVKQWGAAVTVPYATASLVPVEMPCTVGVAGVSEYPGAGHDDA